MKTITKKSLRDAYNLVKEINNGGKSRKAFALFDRQGADYNVTIYKGPEMKFLSRWIVNSAMRKKISPYRTIARSTMPRQKSKKRLLFDANLED